LLQAEVGDISSDDLAKLKSGIVKELTELQGMIG